MSESGLVIVVAAGGLAALVMGTGCFGVGKKDSCATGTVQCGCFANGTCHAGLACLSQVCVNPGLTIDAGRTDGGGTGQGAPAVCVACAETQCRDEARRCAAATGCMGLVNCVIGCQDDASCVAACASGASATTAVEAQGYVACAYGRCLEECTPGGVVTPGTGGRSADPGTGGRGVGPGTGGRVVGPGTGGSGVPGTGGASSTLVPGVNWLVLNENAASESQFPNGALGINGVFYAFGDNCASLSWNPVSRCLSGVLCPFSATTWGVAIGFDFRNSGDIKYPWNAPAAGARGVAWSVSGTSSFQVWITNMDPIWGGQCSAATCNINGPPDGTSSPAFDGSLSFTGLVKENWGGAGVIYTFDPANILALQFKVPSATLGSTTFQICVDQLGIVR
jgi:hypothetical protein